jgi:hypothetical protein
VGNETGTKIEHYGKPITVTAAPQKSRLENATRSRNFGGPRPLIRSRAMRKDNL